MVIWIDMVCLALALAPSCAALHFWCLYIMLSKSYLPRRCDWKDGFFIHPHIYIYMYIYNIYILPTSSIKCLRVRYTYTCNNFKISSSMTRGGCLWVENLKTQKTPPKPPNLKAVAIVNHGHCRPVAVESNSSSVQPEGFLEKFPTQTGKIVQRSMSWHPLSLFTIMCKLWMSCVRFNWNNGSWIFCVWNMDPQ